MFNFNDAFTHALVYCLRAVFFTLGILGGLNTALAGGGLPEAGNLPNIERKNAPQPSPEPNIHAAPEAYAPAQQDNDQITVRLSQLQFWGNDNISKEALDQIALPYLNRDIGFKDLNALTAEISRYYQRKGFILAQAYLPEQDIENGKLQINIIEGKLANLNVNSGGKLNQSFLQRMAAYRMQNGDTLAYVPAHSLAPAIKSVPAMSISALRKSRGGVALSRRILTAIDTPVEKSWRRACSSIT
jgi:hemolysin activation/secretion protein